MTDNDKPLVDALAEALEECRNAMHADNPADGWKEIIEQADAALSRYRAHKEAEPDFAEALNLAERELLDALRAELAKAKGNA